MTTKNKKRLSNNKVALITMTVVLGLILLMLVFSLTRYNENGQGGTIVSVIVAGFLFVVLLLATIREGKDE